MLPGSFCSAPMLSQTGCDIGPEPGGAGGIYNLAHSPWRKDRSNYWWWIVRSARIRVSPAKNGRLVVDLAAAMAAPSAAE